MRITIYAYLILVLFIDSCHKDGFNDSNEIPIACIESEDSVYIGDNVLFNNCSVNADKFLWDFKDYTNLDTSYSPSHAFYSTGTRYVTLIAYNEDKQDTARHKITVVSAPPSNVVNVYGVYTVTTDCNPTPYTLSITMWSSHYVYTSGFMHQGIAFDNMISSPSYPFDQMQESSIWGEKDSVSVQGVARIDYSGDTLQINYIATENGITYTCTGIGIRH